MNGREINNTFTTLGAFFIRPCSNAGNASQAKVHSTAHGVSNNMAFKTVDSFTSVMTPFTNRLPPSWCSDVNDTCTWLCSSALSLSFLLPQGFADGLPSTNCSSGNGRCCNCDRRSAGTPINSRFAPPRRWDSPPVSYPTQLNDLACHVQGVTRV